MLTLGVGSFVDQRELGSRALAEAEFTQAFRNRCGVSSALHGEQRDLGLQIDDGSICSALSFATGVVRCKPNRSGTDHLAFLPFQFLAAASLDKRTVVANAIGPRHANSDRPGPGLPNATGPAIVRRARLMVEDALKLAGVEADQNATVTREASDGEALPPSGC